MGFLNQRKAGLSKKIEPAFLPFMKLVDGFPTGVRNIPNLGERVEAFNKEKAKIKADSLNAKC